MSWGVVQAYLEHSCSFQHDKASGGRSHEHNYDRALGSEGISSRLATLLGDD